MTQATEIKARELLETSETSASPLALSLILYIELTIYLVMPGYPNPLPFLTFPTYRQKLLYDVNRSTHCVMSYDPVKLELVKHYWRVILLSTMQHD